MQAWQVIDSGAHPMLQPATVSEPIPAHGELLIRVRAAGVTPTELLWYPTTHTPAGTPRTQAVPGHEFAGVVEAIGPGTNSDFEVGQEVFGMNSWFADGATAEFCITRPEWIAAKPRQLSFAEAAAVPIGALTAWQGLYDRAKLASGEMVLIHGAAGAVGVFAVQLARLRGAKIIATASASNHNFLTGLGAERVIDYHTERFEDLVRNADVVFDSVGGATLEHSWSVLAPTGRLVTIAANSEGTTDERTKQAFFIVEPSQPQLTEIAAMLDSGALRTFVHAEVPFSQAGSAYDSSTKRGPTRGKVVVVL